MKLKKYYRPEIVCSKDPKQQTSYCYLDGSTLVATDGYMLVAVPVELEEKDTSGYVLPAALVAARRLADKNQPVTMAVNGAHVLADGTTIPRPQPSKIGEYPRWLEVVPHFDSADNDVVTFGVDIDLLARAAKALGTSQVKVTMSRHTKEHGPIMLTSDDRNDTSNAYAIVMPLI